MRVFLMDHKLNISEAYLRPGFAFGGSCLPKDLRALVSAGRAADLPSPVLSAILPSNELQVRRAIEAVLGTRKRRVGVVGLAFKPGTDDLRARCPRCPSPPLATNLSFHGRQCLVEPPGGGASTCRPRARIRMVNMEVMGMLTGTRRSRRPAIPRVMAGITAAVLMSVPAPGSSAAGPHAGVPKLAVAADPTATARVVKSFGRLLPGLEVHRGQVAAQVKFLTRGSGYTLFLTPSEAVLGLPAPYAMPPAGQALVSTAEVRMHLAGATAQPRVAGVEKLPGIVNYFLGNDPAQWHADIPTYAEVVYQGVYPGIDLIHHGTQGRLEYDFVVGPGG